MFATIRRHQKWLWVLIIGVIIVTFVIFFSPQQLSGGGGGGGGEDGANANFGEIDGHKISRQEYGQAYREAALFYRLSYRTWPGSDEMSRRTIDNQTRNRLVIAAEVRRLNLHIGDKAVAAWIVERFKDPKTGIFNKGFYDQFVKQELEPNNVGEEDFQRFAKHEVAIQHLISVFGLSGRLVPPREAEAAYRRDHEQITIEVVPFSVSNFLSQVSIHATNLTEFFTNRMALYRIPEKVAVSYVKFEVTNFLAEVDQKMSEDKELSQKIDQAYLRQGTNLFTDAKGNPMTPVAAKEKIREDYRHAEAMIATRRKAGEFANELYEMTNPPKAENLAKLAAAKGLELKITEPFAEEDGPRNLKVLESFNKAAFSLSEAEPLVPPLPGEDAVYQIAFHQRIPSEVPAFETVQARVTEDYRRFKAIEMARSRGIGFAFMLTNGLVQGKAFAAICSDAKVEAIALPSFALSTTALPEAESRNLDLSMLKAAISGVPQGQGSGFQPNREGGLVVYVQARKPVEEAALKAGLPAFLNELRQERQYAAFGEWMGQQVARARLPGSDTKVGAE